MRTEIEALKEIRDRISYFCSRTDGKYDPPWAQEVIGIIDDVLITPYRQCKRFGAPFYVEVGTSIVAIRCASNHDVVWRADHSVHGKSTVDWAESVCTRMNQEAHKRERVVAAKCCQLGRLAGYGASEIKHQQEPVGNAAKLREALEFCVKGMCGFCRMDAEARGMMTRCVHGCEALLMAKAALAAPPRNCDLYKTKEKAQEAFMKEPCDHPCGNCWVEDINNECGVEWLFAPATEKK